MQEFEKKCEESIQHFKNGDHDLAFRRLIDCALDCGEIPQYKSCLDLVEWKSQYPNDLDGLSEKSILFLTQLKTRPVQISEPGKLILEAQNVEKIYSRGRFKLGSISMKIHAGDVWGLVGENGNGKTTLLRMLAKDLSFDSGELKFHVNTENGDLYDERTHLTYIPQRTPTWYGSLKSNLKFAASHYGIHGEENEWIVLMYIARFGLWDYRNHQWSELSSGYKMRFELARTFLRKPKVLLLDEPLANLDVLAQQLILEDLKSLSQSLRNPLGIILSSQQLFEVEKVSDKIIFLKRGEPTYLADANDVKAGSLSVVELDCKANREELMKALKGFDNLEIRFNGGLYLISVDKENAVGELLTALLSAGISIKYFRDISHSTRRLFV